jgi:cell division protein ZapA
MAQVDITVNGRLYKVTCENGQEARLQQLASHFDRHVTQLSRDVGQVGEARLMLLAALQLTDELFEARRRVSDLERGTQALDSDTLGGAARLLDLAARKVDALADKVAAV